MLITFSLPVFAAVLDDEENGTTETISPDQYEGAQKEDKENKKDNENKKEDSLPQTGIEDSGLGLLLIVCIGSAIFAFKKVSDYRNI